MESKGVQNKRKHNVSEIKTKQNDMCYSNQLELKQSTTKCNIMWWIYFKQHNQRRINAKLLLRNLCYGSAQSTQKAVSNQKSNVSYMYYICLPEIQIKKNPLMIRPTWIIIQNRSKNTSLLPLRTLQPFSRGMLSSTEKHT